MDLTLATSQFAVYDNVLPADAFTRLVVYLESEDYSFMQPDVLHGIVRPEDGQPIHRKRVYYALSVPLSTLVPGADKQAEVRRHADIHPTGWPVDPVFDAIKLAAGMHPDLVGEPQTGWKAVTGKIYIYRAGTGLSWHWDSDTYSGAHIFYAHPEWNAQWGGELLVADPSCLAIKRRLGNEMAKNVPGKAEYPRKHFLATPASGDLAVMEKGIGHFVSPKPNRLVILKGNQPHMVAKVNAAAGNHLRISFTGFFLTPTGLSQVLKPLDPAMAAR